MNKEQTYQFPITVLIEILKGQGQRVVLRAPVPALPGKRKRTGIAEIMVDEQGLRACVITEQGTGDPLFQEQEAFNMLQQCGMLGWVLQPSQALSERTRSPPAHSQGVDPIPCRRQELTPAQMQALPSAHKKVFALVNGRNALASIAHLLTKSRPEVSRVLLELKQRHLIDF
jgi:hypothetical protein